MAKAQPKPSELNSKTVKAIAEVYRSMGLTIRTPDLMRRVREEFPSLRGQAMFDHVEAAGTIVKEESNGKND
jgi:hypothetical protein